MEYGLKFCVFNPTGVEPDTCVNGLPFKRGIFRKMLTREDIQVEIEARWSSRWAKTSFRFLLYGFAVILLSVLFFILGNLGSIFFLFGGMGFAVSLLLLFISGLIGVLALPGLIIQKAPARAYLYSGCSVLLGLSVTGAFICVTLLSPVIHHRIILEKKNQYQLERIGQTLLLYAERNQGKWPPQAVWLDCVTDIDPDIRAWKVLIALNSALPEFQKDTPSDMVLAFGSKSLTGGLQDVWIARSQYLGKKHAGILFANGRVEFIKAEDIPSLKWTLEEQAANER